MHPSAPYSAKSTRSSRNQHPLYTLHPFQTCSTHTLPILQTLTTMFPGIATASQSTSVVPITPALTPTAALPCCTHQRTQPCTTTRPLSQSCLPMGWYVHASDAGTRIQQANLLQWCIPAEKTYQSISHCLDNTLRWCMWMVTMSSMIEMLLGSRLCHGLCWEYCQFWMHACSWDLSLAFQARVYQGLGKYITGMVTYVSTLIILTNPLT